MNISDDGRWSSHLCILIWGYIVSLLWQVIHRDPLLGGINYSYKAYICYLSHDTVGKVNIYTDV